MVEGIANPRGFTWGADGTMYLAVTGSGGDTPAYAIETVVHFVIEDAICFPLGDHRSPVKERSQHIRRSQQRLKCPFRELFCFQLPCRCDITFVAKAHHRCFRDPFDAPHENWTSGGGRSSRVPAAASACRMKPQS